MSNIDKTAKENGKNIKDTCFYSMSNENGDLFRSALLNAMDLKIKKIEEETMDIEIPPPSKRHKKRMNRLFRERVGGGFLPFPEQDNFYERVRSKLVRKLKINAFFKRHEKCRQERRKNGNTSRR